MGKHGKGTSRVHSAIKQLRAVVHGVIGFRLVDKRGSGCVLGVASNIMFGMIGW